MAKKPQVMMQNSPVGIVVNPRTDSLVLPFPGDYSHLFSNKTDWSRAKDLTDTLGYGYPGTSFYLGGGTVNNWLFRGERGRDTDLLAVVPNNNMPEWFRQLILIGQKSKTEDKRVQLGNYGYSLGDHLQRLYMCIDTGVESVSLNPVRTLEEHSLNVTPKTIDLSVTSEANFRRCYKNLNRTGAD